MFKKYIIINGEPILFPSKILRADVAGELLRVVESAGFFTVINEEGKSIVYCFGDSSSIVGT